MIQETIEEIEARLMAKLLVTPPFDSYNLSPSAVALYSNFLNTIATEIFSLQQLMNTFETDLEAVVAAAVFRVPSWIQAEVLKFEYNATTNPVAAVNEDFTVGYPDPVAANRIITNCSVVVSGSGVVNIKVAKDDGSGSPTPLSAGEVTVLNAYLDAVLGAGINYNVINYFADTLQVTSEVFYNGQYNAVIKTNVEAALAAYMDALPFNGTVRISDIERAILAVPGVVDVTFSQITGTPGTAAAIGAGTPVNLILASTLVSRNYQTASGYIVNASAPNDFDTTITYTVAAQ